MDALLVTPAEAASITKLSRSRIYLELATGRLQSIRVGRARRIRISALTTWIEQMASEQAEGRPPSTDRK